MLLQVKGLIHIIVASSGLKKNSAHFCHPPVIFLREAPLNIAIRHQVLCSNKGTNWKFIFPWRKINWHVLQTPKGSIQLLDLVNDFLKKYYAMAYTFLHHGGACMHQESQQKTHTKKFFARILALNYLLPSCVLAIFVDMNTYMYVLTERRNSKTFWKENYAIGLDSCYFFNLEHGTEHDIDSTYEFACIRYSWTLRQMNLRVF